MTSCKHNTEFARFHYGFVVIAEFPHLETTCKLFVVWSMLTATFEYCVKPFVVLHTEFATLNTCGYTIFANCICAHMKCTK